jgi:hypothetical protein
MTLGRIRRNPQDALVQRSAQTLNEQHRSLVARVRGAGAADWLLWAGLPMALVAGLLLGLFSSFAVVAFAAGLLVLAYLFLLEQWALLAVVVVGAGLLVDFFMLFPLPLNFPALATGLALLFLAALFLTQSASRPWIRVPHLGWWIAVLVLTLPQAVRGGLEVNGGIYYVQVFVNALLLYVVGVQVARDVSLLRRLFSILAGFATLIAIHSILQARTGNVLHPTHFWDNYMASVHYFRLSGSQSIRAGSFFLNPDSDGTFLAVMLFIPVSLLVEAPSKLLKALYAVEALLILLGLFFTYSLISLAAVGVGTLLFIVLVTKGRYRFYALGLIGVLVLAIAVALPEVVHLLASRSSGATQEISLRLGSWETALRVILAYPFTGLGFGFHAYLDGAEPYRSALQYTTLSHPHDSFLEFAALGGIPVLLVMLVLFAKSFWRAITNYRAGERSQRILVGGGITALTIMTLNSVASNSWTLAPLVLIGWLLFGALCSPALIPPLRQRALAKHPLSEEKPLPDEEGAALLSGGVES